MPRMIPSIRPTGVGSRFKRLLTVLCMGMAVVLVTSPQAAAQEDSALWYETEAINPGLQAPPEEMDRSSPRIALRTFVEHVQANDPDRAAHVLNLANLPEAEQAARGADLAARLASTIDRKLRIDWATIPPEPDARPTMRPNDQAPPQPRRDYLLNEFEVDGRSYAIRLSRYAVPTPDGQAEDPVWLISTDTVANIDALYNAFGPREFEAYVPDGMKAQLGWLRIWEWIALPLLFGAVVLVGALTHWLVRLGRYLSKGRVMRRAFEHAALPLSLVTASLSAQWLMGFIVSLSGPATAVVYPILVMVSVFGFGLAALRAIDALLDHVTRRHLGKAYDAPSSSEREFYTSMYALRRTVLVLMVGFSLVYVLMQFNMFADVGVTLLASAGVLTVLLGIAGQVTLGNIVASLQIAIAKPVRIGDSIHYEGTWCVVESIYFTFIRLRTWDERRIIVPVKYFLSYPFNNWSVINERLFCTIRLVLDPMADVAILREKFLTLARANADVIEHDKLSAYLTGHAIEGLTVEFYVMAPDPWTAWTIEMGLREELVHFIQTEHPEWWPHERVQL